MSREDRRAAIAEATVPLLERHGATVTTRQIAEAAGVAEGTLFKAFSDKRELLMAAASRVFDAGAAVREIQAMPRHDDLAGELTAVVELLNSTAQRIRRIMLAVHALAVAESRDGAPPPRPHDPPGRDARSRAFQELNDALTRRFVPFREALRIEPEVLARLLLSTVMGRIPPGIPEDDLTVDLLVDVLLHGAAA